MRPFIIRPATPHDTAAIVALWRDSLALHGQRDPTFLPRADGHLRFERFLTGVITDPEAAVVTAEVDGRIAAYGVCVLRTRPEYFEPGEYGLVTDLDVSGEHRRQGLGEAVLDALCDWVRARGIRRIEAEVVAANELAVGFWRKLGFATYYQAMARDL